MRAALQGALVVAMLQTITMTAQTALMADPSQSPEERAAQLVHRMTLEEKASQLVNQARAVPRLGVPSYDWWSEALHGVARDGVTEFPEPIGLAATFDPAAIRKMAEAIGTEGRVLNARVVKSNGGYSGFFQGWAWPTGRGCRVTIRGITGRSPRRSTLRFTAGRSPRATWRM